MSLRGQGNGEILQVSLGQDDVMERLTQQFPDAIAAANLQIAKMAGSFTLVSRFTVEELSVDRSDEMAIVGEVKK